MADTASAAQQPSSSFFCGKAILAPMVRVCSLGFRTLCADNGADVVFTEEVVAAKLRQCRREVRLYPPPAPPEGGASYSSSPEGRALADRVDVRSGEVVAEYVLYEPYKKAFKRTVALAVHVGREEGGGGVASLQRAGVPVVLQLGARDPQTAADAAALCCRDISGVDVNMGCPKNFSVKNGFGAALMDNTATAGAILKHIHARINAPEALAARHNRVIPVSLKTRLKDREEAVATVDMLRDIASAAGHSLSTPVIHAVTLHARVRDQRSCEPPLLSVAAEVVRLCRHDASSPLSNVCFVLNGSVGGREDGAAKCAELGFDGFMMARSALWDPLHVFRGSSSPPAPERVASPTEAHYMASLKALMLYSVRYRTDFHNFKYHLSRTFPEVACIKHRMPVVQERLRCYEDCFDFFGLSEAERASCRAWEHGIEMVDAIPASEGGSGSLLLESERVVNGESAAKKQRAEGYPVNGSVS